MCVDASKFPSSLLSRLDFAAPKMRGIPGDTRILMYVNWKLLELMFFFHNQVRVFNNIAKKRQSRLLVLLFHFRNQPYFPYVLNNVETKLTKRTCTTWKPSVLSTTQLLGLFLSVFIKEITCVHLCSLYGFKLRLQDVHGLLQVGDGPEFASELEAEGSVGRAGRFYA